MEQLVESNEEPQRVREIFEFRLGKCKKVMLIFEGEPITSDDFEKLDKHLVLVREMLFDGEINDAR